jgi:5'-nucleotidase
MQAFSHGQYLAWAEVDLSGQEAKSDIKGFAEVCGNEFVYLEKGVEKRTCDPKRLKKLEVEGILVPAEFLGVQMVADARVDELLREEIKEVEELKNSKINAEARIEFERSYGEESALGNLIADATKVTTSLEGLGLSPVDLGLANGGGIRANLPAGSLTYGNLFNVLPFDNQLAVIQVDGELLKKIIAHGISGKQGALLWSGLEFSAKGCEVESVTINGEEISPVKMYSIATSDYLAMGGSGFNSLGIPKSAVTVYWDQPYILRDLVVKALPKMSPLDPQSFFSRSSPRQRRNGKCGG